MVASKLHIVSGLKEGMIKMSQKPCLFLTTIMYSTGITHRMVSDILTVTNQVIQFVQNTPSYVTVSVLDLESLKFHPFSDSSFNKLPNNRRYQGCSVLLGDRIHNTAQLPRALPNWNMSQDLQSLQKHWH